MSVFIPIYCHFEPHGHTAPVHLEVQTSLTRYAVDGGGSAAFPHTLPGTSADNPIVLDGPSTTESDSNPWSNDLYHPGDSVDNPIDLDAASTAESETEVIDSLLDDSYQAEHSIAGTSLDYYVCKICYGKAVDLALGCGHTYCYDCFNKFFHDSILRKAGESQEWAKMYLLSRYCEPSCPFCKKTFPGQFAPPNDRNHLEGFYFPLHCPDTEHPHCFIEEYVAQGIRLKML
ncbi:hypothetical protein PHISCL_08665 [Aspergillus sclerotialis]|uniref:RING-type domain-containing protein n=1 Tax=Aspergillus sclerotialis TaxID=2070753 RepID=A0A3A2Z9U4_9EURO|nr:hypothetical protein PHISCL_08665 [Aspergillus sclerotialis]